MELMFKKLGQGHDIELEFDDRMGKYYVSIRVDGQKVDSYENSDSLYNNLSSFKPILSSIGIGLD